MQRLILVAVVGCGAHVNDFRIEPDHLCQKGGPVHLVWNVTGTATMTSPAGTDGPNGDIEDAGDKVIHPRSPGRIELHVTRFLGAATTSWQDIWFDHLAQSIAVGLDHPSAKCDDKNISATATVSGFDQGITVTSIGPRHLDARTYRVTHAGAQGVHVGAATGPVTAFAGKPISGDWILESPLSPDEHCGQPSLPATLGIEIYTACRGDLQ
jgi:hypothetical protein